MPVLAALVIGFATWPAFYRDLAEFCDSNTKLQRLDRHPPDRLLFLIVPMLMAASFAFEELKGWFILAAGRQPQRAGAAMDRHAADGRRLAGRTMGPARRYAGRCHRQIDTVRSCPAPTSAISTGR